MTKTATTPRFCIFETQQDWEVWLTENHATSAVIWLQLAKKGSGIATITYDDAIEIALCYGWIDGQKQSHSERYWLQKFTPRSKKSVWSKINRAKAQALIDAGKMKAAGLKDVELAKNDGRWEAAYDSASKLVVPDDFQAVLDGNTPAKAFFDSLDRRNRYAVLFRIQTAKTAETRHKKISQLVEMLARHEKIHP